RADANLWRLTACGDGEGCQAKWSLNSDLTGVGKAVEEAQQPMLRERSHQQRDPERHQRGRDEEAGDEQHEPRGRVRLKRERLASSAAGVFTNRSAAQTP